MTVHADDLAPLPAGQLTPPVPVKGKVTRAIRLPRNPKVIAGLIIIAAFAILTLVGPWVAPYSPNDNSFAQNLHPSAAHWLGTSNLRRGHLLPAAERGPGHHGGRASSPGLVATVLSVIIGITAGYLGGGTDEGLSLTANVFLAIPGLPLLIVLLSYLPAAGRSNTLLIGVIIAITGWAWGARVLRAQTLSVKRRDFVEAARIIGESRIRIMFSEVLPNLVAIVASSFLFTMLYAIGTYIALAYLGVTSTSVWNWGTMLYWAQTSNAPLTGAWWWFVPPGSVYRPGRHGAGPAELRRGRVHQPAAAGRGPVQEGHAQGRAAPAPQAGPDPGGQEPARLDGHGGDRGRAREGGPMSAGHVVAPVTASDGEVRRRTRATRYWRSAGCAWTTGGAKRPCTRWWTPT